MKAIPFSPGCEYPDGWHWRGDPPAAHRDPLDSCTIIELCENTCERLRNHELDDLSFWFGCALLETP